ncbi:hypothetical protein BpHYR1_041515 [Brachionus plicatilis]|uniref:Uncharacterized protein n=1 Tax=Brachionus plicatilis TaxID=10195 RepID=A0A3M7S4A6_BRAPC|nr:hypothetical protein BpHYR1_041515 [Brachionus plicatilis]
MNIKLCQVLLRSFSSAQGNTKIQNHFNCLWATLIKILSTNYKILSKLLTYWMTKKSTRTTKTLSKSRKDYLKIISNNI